MKLIISPKFTAFVFAGFFAVGSFSAPVVAQEKVRYSGNLSGNMGSCPWNSREIRIEVAGEQVTASWQVENGNARAVGDVKGNSFRIFHNAKNGEQSSVGGTIDGERIEVRIEAKRCNYRSVLNKS